MKIHGFGLYPKLESEIIYPRTFTDCLHSLQQHKPLIARGMGRSYGDSSLSPNILTTCHLNYFYSFDKANGILTCEAGVTLAQILEIFVPLGWFLPVTPGTRFISLGGAIASDVHGKNHHLEGTFTQYVLHMEMLLGDGRRVMTSPTQLSDLFHATCGGMGLTGIILNVSIRLKPINSSNILQSTLKLPSLKAVLSAFEEYKDATYSVAWIDCLAKGKNLGRSLLMLGEHASESILKVPTYHAISIPCPMPSFLLNKVGIKIFNQFYYHRQARNRYVHPVPYESFFYPLDKLANWNRLYGKLGFMQYQFVLPSEASEEGLRQILTLIADTGKGSFLAVLKCFGKSNLNYLSFPIPGVTLALDFKVEPSVFALFNKLDQMVLHYGGRHYLCKDARLSEKTFKLSYPTWEQFECVREKYYAVGKFSSYQSKRLGLL